MHEWPVKVSVNGQPTEATVEPRLTLADYLRERCGLTGTHLGCEHGACGACTVLVDGQALRSCLMFAVQADGCEVTNDSPARRNSASSLVGHSSVIRHFSWPRQPWQDRKAVNHSLVRMTGVPK